MPSLEESLAAILQAEVDKRIAAVQEAADAWVAAFAVQARKLAVSGVSNPGLPTPTETPEAPVASNKPLPGASYGLTPEELDPQGLGGDLGGGHRIQ